LLKTLENKLGGLGGWEREREREREREGQSFFVAHGFLGVIISYSPVVSISRALFGVFFFLREPVSG
jgi:hypothetical protein